MTTTSEVPRTMHAWRKHKGITSPVWEEVAVPEPPPNGVVCRMLASGVCRSDKSLLTMDDSRPWFQEKYTLGHEGCGEIVRLGRELEKAGTEFKIGQIVALHAVPGCGEAHCSECSRDLAQLCERGHHSGIGQDGFYVPFASIDVRGLVLVPQGVSPAEAAVATDAVATAWHAITRRGEAKPHETVFLFGLGGLGFNALQILMSIGCKVTVSDICESLLREAQKLGLPESNIVPQGQNVQDFTAKMGLSGTIDTIFDFVGTHQTFEDSQQIVRRGGKIVNIGTLDTKNTIHMKIGIRKRLSFIFSCGALVSDLREVLDQIAKGNIRPQVETASMKDLPQLIRDLTAGMIRSRIAIIHE